jgi:hypothetical protein
MPKIKRAKPKRIEYFPSFEELKKLFIELDIIREEAAFLVVPASTYGGLHKCRKVQELDWKRAGANCREPDGTWVAGEYFIKIKSKVYFFNDQNMPVLMRGAWHITKLVAGNDPTDYRSKHICWHTNSAVRERFLKFYKATTIAKKDAEFWADKLNTLMDRSKKDKRYVYHRTTFENRVVYPHQLNLRNEFFYVFGDPCYCYGRERFQIVKTIYRHIKKLSSLTNQSKEKEKWQQLIQQAI